MLRVEAGVVSLEAAQYAFAITLETDKYVVQLAHGGTYEANICPLTYVHEESSYHIYRARVRTKSR